MTFKILLLWSFVLLGRPQDLLIFLQPLRPALILTVITFLGLIFSSHQGRLSAVFAIPQVKRYLIFFLIMIIGIPLAFLRGKALESVIFIYFPNILFFLALVLEVNSLKRLYSIIFIICLSTFMYGFFGLIFSGDKEGRYSIYGTMFDPNDIAYVLNSLFPICFFYFIFNKGLLIKQIAIVAICSAIAVILLSASRGGLIGLATVLAIFFFTKIGNFKRYQKVIFLLAVVGVYFLSEDAIDLERYLTIFNIESDYNMTGEIGRMKIWTYGMEMILDNPITGVGFGSFSSVIMYMRMAADITLLKMSEPHNSYLQIAAEIGLIGFSIFFIMIVHSLRTFRSISKMEALGDEATELKIVSGLMFAGFLGSLVSAFFLSQGYSLYFTLYFALATVMQRLQAEVSADPSSTTEKN